MKKRTVSLVALLIFTVSLSGCSFKNEAKASSAYEDKESIYFFNEKEIKDSNLESKYAKKDVSPKNVIDNTKEYSGIYSLQWESKKDVALDKNLLKVNEDGTFIELRVLKDNSEETTTHYYVDKKNKLHTKNAINYELLSGYVVKENNQVSLSYADSISFYKAVNQKGEEKISPLSQNYNYQLLDDNEAQTSLFVKDGFEINADGESVRLVKVVPKETPKELTVTPLEINNFLKKSQENLASKHYEFNNINDFIQFMSPQTAPSDEVKLLDITSYQNVETEKENHIKAKYAFSTTSSNNGNKVTNVYLFDGQNIYFSNDETPTTFQLF